MATVQEGFTDLPVSKPRRSPTAAPRLSTPVLRRSKIDLEDRVQGLTLTVPPRGSATVTSPFRLHFDPPCAPTSGTASQPYESRSARWPKTSLRRQFILYHKLLSILLFTGLFPLFCTILAFLRTGTARVSLHVFLPFFVGLRTVRCGTSRASVPLILQPSSYSAR